MAPMNAPLRVVHYVNQFFGGIGGEDQADVGVTVRAGAVGPGRPLETALGGDARVEATIVCGDNFANDRAEEFTRAVARELERLKPDLLVAGPAFGSGRYGLACANVCEIARHRGIPAITAMHPENPGASAARRGIYIVPTGASTTSMPAALESLSPKEWEAHHAGYFNHIVNSNPNYILPLSFLRDLERQGRIGKVHEHIYALPGVSTPVAVSAAHGRSIAADLKAGGVEGALLVAT